MIWEMFFEKIFQATSNSFLSWKKAGTIINI